MFAISSKIKGECMVLKYTINVDNIIINKVKISNLLTNENNLFFSGRVFFIMSLKILNKTV